MCDSWELRWISLSEWYWYFTNPVNSPVEFWLFYPIIYKALGIPGVVGFLVQSTVEPWFAVARGWKGFRIGSHAKMALASKACTWWTSRTSCHAFSQIHPDIKAYYVYIYSSYVHVSQPFTIIRCLVIEKKRGILNKKTLLTFKKTLTCYVGTTYPNTKKPPKKENIAKEWL